MTTPNYIPFVLIAAFFIQTPCPLEASTCGGDQPFAKIKPPTAKPRTLHRVPEKAGELQLNLRTVSPEEKIASELEVAELKGLVEGWNDLPKVGHFERTVRNDVEARIALREIGGRSSETIYVMIHGIFGEGSNWRYVISALGGEREVWAVDLMGNGLSDCPDPKMLGPGGYSPEALVERVLQALEARLSERPDVSKIILVGCSLGGAVSLRGFMDADLRERYAGVLSRVQGLVLFAPADVVITQVTDSWNSFFAINRFKAGVGNALQILQYKIAQSTLDTFYRPELATRETAEGAIRVVRERRYRESTQAIMRDAVQWRVFRQHADFEAAARLEATYQNVKTPVLIVWGKCDETIPESTGYKMKDQLPNARLVTLPATKHLPSLERPRVCALLIREFHQQLITGKLLGAHSVRTLNLDSADSAEQNLLAIQTR